MSGSILVLLGSALSVAAPGGPLPRDADAAHGETQITVVGTRTGDLDGATTVITSSDIAQRSAPTLLDPLNDVAGVRAVSTGGIGGGSFVSIRGGDPNFALVLIDGVRVNDATNAQGGAFDFGLVDPSLVETVEVRRNATSAVLGSDALSGVVNIRLRKPVHGVMTTARFTGGTDGEVGGGATFNIGWYGGGLLLGGNAFSSGASDRGSHLDRRQFLASASQTVGSYAISAFALYGRNTHNEFPLASGGPERAVSRDRETGDGDLWQAAIGLHRVGSARVRADVSLSWSEQHSNAVTPAIPAGVLNAVPASAARNRQGRVEAIADVVAELGPATATGGGALLEETSHSRGTLDFGFPIPTDFSIRRLTVSGFAEATLRPGGGLSINAAGRYDAPQNQGGEWTSRFGVTWQPMAGAPSLFFHAGEGFKLPSFYALGNPLVGDPGLRPERSHDLEAGAKWQSKTVTVRLAWFKNRYRDLIDFDPSVFRLVNRSSVGAQGFEAELSSRFSSRLSAAASLTHVVLEGPAPLLNRPRWQGSARLLWQARAGVDVSGSVRFNGSFLDSSVPTGLVAIGGHAEADVGVSWRVAQGLTVGAALRNITDDRSEIVVGYPQLGRRGLLTLGIQGP